MLTTPPENAGAVLTTPPEKAGPLVVPTDVTPAGEVNLELVVGVAG